MKKGFQCACKKTATVFSRLLFQAVWRLDSALPGLVPARASAFSQTAACTRCSASASRLLLCLLHFTGFAGSFFHKTVQQKRHVQPCMALGASKKRGASTGRSHSLLADETEGVYAASLGGKISVTLFAARRAAGEQAKSLALLRKAAETDVHAAGFGTKIGGLRPSDASQGFFDSLKARRQASFQVAEKAEVQKALPPAGALGAKPLKPYALSP